MRKSDRKRAIAVGGRQLVINGGRIVVAALHHKVLDKTVDTGVLIHRMDVAEYRRSHRR